MISFDEKTLVIDGHEHELEYPVTDAVEVHDRVIVLYDPDSFSSKVGQFNNLIAISLSGALLWVAELPTTTTGDRYYRFVAGENLEAFSVFSYICEIDLGTGRIASREFVK